MWTPKWFRNIKKDYILKKYMGRLEYAIKRLEKPVDGLSFSEKDRLYKLEIARWLFAYYMGHSDAVGEGSPEIKLRKLLRKGSFEVTPRDYVYIGVLHNWIERKRIEGY